MARYIDAEVLCKEHFMCDCLSCKDCYKTQKEKISCEYYSAYSLQDFCGWISEIPSIDVVKVVHGEWVVCDAPPPTWWYECSICHKAGNVEYNYCPNCGAEMRGGNDDSEMCTIGKGKETMSDDPDMSCQAY